MLISGRCGINVRKTRTPEAPGLREPWELAKPTGAVGLADLAKMEVEVESAKLIGSVVS